MGVKVGQPHAEIGLLGYQPATGCEPGGHPLQRSHPAGDVHEDGTNVHQVKGAFWEVIGAHVVTEHSQVRQR